MQTLFMELSVSFLRPPDDEGYVFTPVRFSILGPDSI